MKIGHFHPHVWPLVRPSVILAAAGMPVSKDSNGNQIPVAARVMGDSVIRKTPRQAWQLFRVEGECVLRQVGNGLATKKPIGPCQCSRSRNPKSPADIPSFPSPVTSLYHSEAKTRPGTRRQPGETNLRRHFFILGLSLVRSRGIRSLFVSAGERIVRAKKGSQRYSFPIRFRGGTNSPGEKRQPEIFVPYSFPQGNE